MGSSARISSGRQSGFTLAEMLAALGILLVGITSLLGALSSSVGQRRTTDARLAAAAVVEEAILELRQEGIRMAPDAETDLDLEIDPSTVHPVAGFPGMTWSASVTMDETRPDLWLVRLEVRWLEEGEDASEVFWRILPRALPLGRRVARFRDEVGRTSAR